MAELAPQFGLALATNYYVVMHSRTQIHLPEPNISIPRLPSRFMEFHDAARLRNKQLTDVIGIVVDVSPVRFHKSFERSMPCRDVVLMSIRREFICMRIWDKHVSRHMMKWRRAEREMSILAATLLEVSEAQGALKSTDESHIVFEPNNLLAVELAAYRQTLGPTHGSILTQVRAFVINAYIYYLRAQEHLHNRAGGQVWLDSTHISEILKRDGELFIPVNVKDDHWYLCNVDAPNRRIQVLDSLGSRMSRPKLQLTLQGLENHLKIASQISDFNKGDKWPDLEVTNWPIEECIHEPMQSDGSSCGLFLLKLMEHWTGDELAHAVTQTGIKLFRKQLAIILHESVLNDLKGTPEYEQLDVKGDTSDVVMWDKNDPPPTEVSQASEVANDPSPSLKMPKMLINKNELVSKLRNYILSIDDDEAMKEIWVQSSKPYPISLSLKQLKDLLKDTHGIDTDCFNMAVRVNATDELQWAMDTPYHYMDLQLCNIVTDSMRDPRLRLPFDTKRQIIARIFDCWRGMYFHVSSCNSILIPYRTTGRFILFVFNLGERTITILDPIPLPDMWKTSLLNKDTLKLKDISFHLNIALQDAIQGWNDDVFL
ncbi:hypothetical protein ACQ4PT_054215 [Festuca glaucescens]